MKQPLLRQFLLPMALLLTAAVVGSAGLSTFINWSRQAAALRAREVDVARVLESATFPLTAGVLRQLAELTGLQLAVWNAEAGAIIETTLPGDRRELAARVSALLQATNAHQQPAALAWQGDHYSARVVHSRRQAPGELVLVMSSRQSLIEARLSALWPPLAVGVVSLTVLVPWTVKLSRGWSGRIQRIQQSVARIAKGDRTARLESPDCDDELAALMHDVQRLGNRLDELQSEVVRAERERLLAQVAAAFAHQFRNGVAGAGLALELHASRCACPHDRGLGVARKQLKLLETEVRGVLSLARCPRPARQEFSASECLAEAVDLIWPFIEHRRLQLRYGELDPEVRLEAAREGLRAALVNLLLNAIEAVGAEGIIEVGAHCRDECVVISVRDTGPGPDARVAGSISTAFVSTKPEGAGLGLAVVEQVAREHGGRLDWRRAEGWTTMELWLPLTQHATGAATASGADRR